jgi:hypothetical protein
MNWTAMPSIFPDGIDFVFNATEWPIVAHNRWGDGVCRAVPGRAGDRPVCFRRL